MNSPGSNSVINLKNAHAHLRSKLVSLHPHFLLNLPVHQPLLHAFKDYYAGKDPQDAQDYQGD